MRGMRNIDAKEFTKALERFGGSLPPYLELFERIRRLESKFEHATSERERKRLARTLLEHVAQACRRAGVPTKIVQYLLAMKKVRAQGSPPHAKMQQTAISRAFLASVAMHKAGYTIAEADKWVWSKLPSRDRDLFTPKGERKDRKPDHERIKNWRRRQRDRCAKPVGEDLQIAQSWLDIDAAVRNLKKRQSPPSPELSWEATALKIMRGELILWPVPTPPKRPRLSKLPMSGRLAIDPVRFAKLANELGGVRSPSKTLTACHASDSSPTGGRALAKSVRMDGGPRRSSRAERLLFGTPPVRTDTN
jgi:hypothetical protein